MVNKKIVFIAASLSFSGLSVADDIPDAPRVSYESVHFDDFMVGRDFNVESTEDGININYLSRSGTVNIIEHVLADVEYPGYVVIERVYKFLDNYQFVISTGESGRSCDATTYVFTFNSRSENVTGKTMVDGCSELIDSFADGNKLMVKKDGATSVFYNGETK